MKVSKVIVKIKYRLNKGDSNDYDNLSKFQMEEAFNKALLSWVRRQYRGKNQTKEGDEETTSRIDDLQLLLKVDSLTIRDKELFVESNKLPSDYLYYKRVSPFVSKDGCSNVKIKSHLREEANVDDLITFPSFEFEETFHTLIGNKVNLYHNKDFTVDKLELTYYRKPKTYDFKKLNDEVEFKDDVVELIIDETCKLIASDLELLNAKNLNQERGENDN